MKEEENDEKERGERKKEVEEKDRIRFSKGERKRE